MYELARARVRLPSANRTNKGLYVCVGIEAMQARNVASVRAVGTFTVNPGQIYAKRSRLNARSTRKITGAALRALPQAVHFSTVSR